MERAPRRGSIFPTGVAADSAGDVYLADTNNQTIRLFVISDWAVDHGSNLKTRL